MNKHIIKSYKDSNRLTKHRAKLFFDLYNLDHSKLLKQVQEYHICDRYKAVKNPDCKISWCGLAGELACNLCFYDNIRKHIPETNKRYEALKKYQTDGGDVGELEYGFVHILKILRKK